MGQKFKAFVLSAFWTVLPCFLAGGAIGIFLPTIFWVCVGYISAFTLFFMIFDRVPARLYYGSLNSMNILPLLKYGFTSTDRWPILTTSDILGFGWLYRRYYRYKR